MMGGSGLLACLWQFGTGNSTKQLHLVAEVWSFLENEGYDFSGKIVIPFCSYANMFPEETLLKIVELTPDAVHPRGFPAKENNTAGIEEWLLNIHILGNDK